MSKILDVDKNLSYLNTESIQDINDPKPSTVELEKKAQLERYTAIRKDWEEKTQAGYRSQLFIKNAPPKGLGVFADKNYKQGDTLEYCHCIVSQWKQKYIFEPSYKQYAYWDNCVCRDCQVHGVKGLILLGTGSIVNSTETKEASNVNVIVYQSLSLAIMQANKDIKAGEELLAFHGEAYFNSWCKPRVEQFKKVNDRKNNKAVDVLKDRSSTPKKALQAISAEI